MEKQIICKNCGNELKHDKEICQKCNCKSKIVKMNFTEEIKLTEIFRLRQKVKGFKKFIFEYIFRHKNSSDVKKFPCGVIEERRIDKKESKYYQKVIDKKTNKIVHFENESLTKHNKKQL